MTDPAPFPEPRVSPGLVFRVAALFIPAAAVGTLGHELGHWLAAWGFQCTPVLHFASVSPGCPGDLHPVLQQLGVAAGPLSSMLTGTAGMVLLSRWRRRTNRLDLHGTACTIVALFWSRPLFNLLVQLGATGLGLAEPGAFSGSDEARMSRFLGLPDLTVGGLLAAVALGVCLWTAWRVPQADRTSWFLGAVVGALLGFAVWMTQIGPMLLP